MPRFTCSLVALFLVCSGPDGNRLCATPVQHPKRLVNGYTVDLAPLIKWWYKHDGPRPLSAWVHVTGNIVGTNAAGWIIEGKRDGADKPVAVEGSVREPARVILRDPPIEDFAEFLKLTSALDSLTAQRNSLVAQENQSRAEEQGIAQQQRAYRNNSVHARLLSAEDRQLKQSEQKLAADKKPLEQEIQILKSKLAVFPSPDHYVVDCFALDMQYEFDRLPVYDHGRVAP